MPLQRKDAVGQDINLGDIVAIYIKNSYGSASGRLVSGEIIRFTPAMVEVKYVIKDANGIPMRDDTILRPIHLVAKVNV